MRPCLHGHFLAQKDPRSKALVLVERFALTISDDDYDNYKRPPISALDLSLLKVRREKIVLGIQFFNTNALQIIDGQYFAHFQRVGSTFHHNLGFCISSRYLREELLEFQFWLRITGKEQSLVVSHTRDKLLGSVFASAAAISRNATLQGSIRYELFLFALFLKYIFYN